MSIENFVGGGAMFLMAAVVFYFSTKMHRFWRKLPRHDMTSLVMWMALGLSTISLGGMIEGLYFLSGRASLMMVLGGTIFLIGIVFFGIGMTRLRRILLRMGLLR